MFAKTPLSTRPKPFIPKAEISSSCHTDSLQMVTWGPVAFMDALPAAAAPNHAPNMLDSLQAMPRGRTGAKECSQRWSSRTPSPTGSSMSHSEGSTSADSMPTQGSSRSERFEVEVAFSSDLDGLGKKQDLVVKNTFLNTQDGDKMELSKLFRNPSAPNILLSCPFELNAPTMPKLHDSGICIPCPYVFASRDGCRRGSACPFSHTCSPEDLSKAFYARKASLKARLEKSRKEFKQQKKEAWIAAKQGASDHSTPEVDLAG